MFKKYVAFFTAMFLFISTFPLAFNQKVYAYQNNSYFNDLKIGLVSMSSTSLTLTLGGDYTVNGQTYPSGSILNLVISGTSISLNGTILTQVNLLPSSSTNLLTIATGTISNKYMGSFIVKILNGKLLPVNYLDVENYLKGVVGYEMADNFPLEALKSQAVAARNYALSRVGYEAAKGYDFDDTPSYQTYKGFNANYKNVISAVEQTRGQVLLYNDKLVETLYSAWHGGVSEDSENVWGNTVPYLRSVVDSYESDPWPNGNRVLTNSQIQSALISKGYLASTDTFLRLDLSSITKYASGRVSNINIIYRNSTGVEQAKSVIRDSTRTFLGLPSNLYTVTYDSVSGTYTFSGKGNGHGLGMSQIGAKNRATAGQAFDQILKFYYQGTYLQNLILKASLSLVTQSRNTLLLGDKISFNATASAGNGYGYLFKYVIKNGSNIVFTKDYSSLSALDFTPDSAGSYTAEVYVKDKFSISEYDDKKISFFTVYNNPSLVGLTLSKGNTLVNQSVTASMNVNGGSGSYLYKYELSKDGSVLSSTDFTSDKQFTFTPSQSGNYTITSYVKDSASSKAYDLTASQNFTAYDSPTLVSFNKDIQDVFAGDTVNFTSLTSGGSGSGVKYKYVVTKDGQTVASRDYDLNSSFAFVPDTSGSYEASIYAVDAVSDKEYDATAKLDFNVSARASVSSLTADKTSTLIGSAVNYSINSINGSGNIQYKFVVMKGSTLVTDSGYSISNNFSFTPSAAGTYQVTGYVKDLLSENDFDGQQSISLDAYNSQLSTVTASGYYYEGKSISFNASSTGVSPSGFSYRYEIYNSGKLVTSTSFSNSGSFSFTPSVSGTYTVKVYGKDGLSANDFDSMKQFNFIVNSKPLYLSTLPLSYGITNNDVVSLQNALIKLGYSLSGATGYFGSQTRSAVISFQSSRGLSADGIVGSMTYKALNDALIEKAGIKNLTF